MSTILPFSEACERNKDPILDVLHDHFSSIETVLEIGSGTAQHALHFARSQSHLSWQCSDQKQYLPGISAQLGIAKLSNLLPPIEIDVRSERWLARPSYFDLVYTANTFHIMSSSVVESFFNGINQIAASNCILVVYGPFKYHGEFTSPSNERFDVSLRSRGEGSSIKDFEWVDSLAQNCGFKLFDDHTMPANNQCLIWKKQSTI